MKWPWGTNITKLQAVEVGKFCLNLCQATLIGTLGGFYISKLSVYLNVIITMSGITATILLFVGAMKLFEGVKQYEHNK